MIVHIDRDLGDECDCPHCKKPTVHLAVMGLDEYYQTYNKAYLALNGFIDYYTDGGVLLGFDHG